MYSFIYYYAYKLVEKRNPEARRHSAWLVYLAQVGQLFLIGTVIRRVTGIRFKLPQFSTDPILNRLIILPFFLLWIYVVSKYFYKRFFIIKEKYENRNMITAKNTVLFISLVILPIIIGILLLPH